MTWDSLCILLLVSFSFCCSVSATSFSEEIFVPPLLLKRHPLGASVGPLLIAATTAALSCNSSGAFTRSASASVPCEGRGGVSIRRACITRVVHQSRKTVEVPDEVERAVKSWNRLNEGWLHIVWDDEMLLQFVDGVFPQLSTMYRAYPYGVMREDASRILLVYYYGGVYADSDYELSGPIETLITITRPVAYLGHESGASPAFFLGPPRNELHSHMIDQLPITFEEHKAAKWTYKMILDTNGPNFVREMYESKPGWMCYLPFESFAPCDVCGKCFLGVAHLGNHHHSSVWHADAPLSASISYHWDCHPGQLVAAVLFTVSICSVCLHWLLQRRRRVARYFCT